MAHSIARDIEDTYALAALVAAECKTGDCILLKGDLGAGKTAFARGFIRALQDKKEDVTSPTFNLVQQYNTRDRGAVWHYDLYRLTSAQEMVEIGLEEALQVAITLIEWPELAGSYLPTLALTVTIGFEANSQRRQFTFSGEALRWGACLDKIRQWTY